MYVGIIGIKDCRDGGERVVFPTVKRENVESVEAVVKSFTSNPDKIKSSIDNHTPLVVSEPTADMLCLFNGGNQLHAVSAVRRGLRIASVFLYCEENPENAQTSNKEVLMDNANSFYSNISTSQY